LKNKSEMNRCLPIWLSRPTSHQPTAVLPPWAVLRQIVNHSTYHRGQVAAKLKRLGVEPPITDLISWVKEQTQPTP